VQLGSFMRFRRFAVLFCVAVLVSSGFGVNRVHGELSVEVNRLLVFFRDVLMIDTSQCTVNANELSGDFYPSNSPEFGTRGLKEGKVTLTFYGGGSVDALFEFRGNFLTWCLVYYDVGNTDPIPYREIPSRDPLEMVKSFLERYETFTGDSNVAAMRELVTGVDEPKELTKISGNLKLSISGDSAPDFEWSYTFDGEDYRLLNISFFSPPHIFTLGDQRFRFNMDSSAFPRYLPDSAVAVPEVPTASLLNDSSFSEQKSFVDDDLPVSSSFDQGQAALLISLVAIVLCLVGTIKHAKFRQQLRNGNHLLSADSRASIVFDLGEEKGGRCD
jgi:hypothetical protein